MLVHLNGLLYWPLPLVFWPVPVGMLFWLVFLWARNRERNALLPEHPSSDPAADFDKGSWPLIMHGWRAVRLSALLVALITPPWTEGVERYALYGLGLVMMTSGALLRQHCLRMLGAQFTYRVKVSDGSQVVKRGIYRWIRHPSYTGGMLYNLGIAFTLTNCASVVLVMVGMIVIYVYRVRVEERALLGVDGYREYMKHTKRFVPFVF
jgi:protein-S-isoprenylcysteine O-methyltransferase Ste14